MRTLYENTKSWAFIEANKILKKIESKVPSKGFVLFETGYGPSGLPHIGTFGEVVRTVFVEFAFKQLTDNSIPTKIVCISDDLDGLRKVPDNIPNREMVAQNICKPLTSIPDPFSTHKSYGHHMNARLCSFLDEFKFKYEFISATDMYKNGNFNDMLVRVIGNYDKIMDLMLKNLGEERRETYSPIMPICPKTGKVLQEGVKGVNKEKNTVIYTNEFGEEIEQSVLNGGCKLQWKVDFGARWQALDVDYEIFGKDHGPNAPIYQKICNILGGKGPINFVYELFLGSDGAKISKSKGNGISVEEWLSFAPEESLKLFMYQKPQTAKRLYFDTIPKMVDEYIKYIKAYQSQSEEERLENPVYHIHSGVVPFFDLGGIDFTLLLHLASASSPENDFILWGFINKYNPSLKKGEIEFMDKIVSFSIKYFEKFIKPYKSFKIPNETEKSALTKLLDTISNESVKDLSAEEIQSKVYEVGKESGIDLKDWFLLIYQVFLGQKEGPRVGSFIKLYGTENMVSLMKEKLQIV